MVLACAILLALSGPIDKLAWMEGQWASDQTGGQTATWRKAGSKLEGTLGQSGKGGRDATYYTIVANGKTLDLYLSSNKRSTAVKSSARFLGKPRKDGYDFFAADRRLYYRIQILKSGSDEMALLMHPRPPSKAPSMVYRFKRKR